MTTPLRAERAEATQKILAGRIGIAYGRWMGAIDAARYFKEVEDRERAAWGKACGEYEKRFGKPAPQGDEDA